MKFEIDLDVDDEVTIQSLKNSHETVTKYLKEYEEDNHGWIAIFSTEKKEDVKALKKMKKALALVITDWYNGEL